jgi:hypothetical protein
MSGKDDETRAAEKRGYAKGYVAGQRRKQRALTERERTKRQNAAWNRAFLAALPSCISAEGWTRGDKPINSLASRTKLAADFADDAIKYMRLYP